MHVLNGHFEGRKLVLDDPVPDDLPANAKARITVEESAEPQGPSKALAAIAKMAIDAPDLPTDYSENHDKYLYGTRKP